MPARRPQVRRPGWRALVLAALGALAALALPALALGAKSAEDQPVPNGKSGASSLTGGVGDTMLRLGIGLVVVLALIGGVWWIVKRYRRGKYPEQDARGNGLIDVVGTAALGPNRALHVVRVGDEVVLVGATDHAVTPIARLGDADAAVVDAGALDARAAFDPSSGRGPLDARSRYATAAAANDASLVERLKALTSRR